MVASPRNFSLCASIASCRNSWRISAPAFEIAHDVRADAGPRLLGDGRRLQQIEEAALAGVAAARERLGELQVLLAAGDVFGDREVVGIEAGAANVARFTLRQLDQPRAPTLRQLDRRFLDGIGVVAVLRVEGRSLAERVEPGEAVGALG